MIYVLAAMAVAHAQATGETASTGDTSAPVRTALHDRIESANLLVHAEVTASAGVTLLGGKRRWVQTLEILEVFHENHSRTALSVGDSISLFSWHDDSSTYVALTFEASHVPVGDAAVYFLEEWTYTDSTGTEHDVWRTASGPPLGNRVDRQHRRRSVLVPIDYGGTTGEIAGMATSGRAIVRNDPDDYTWINAPQEPRVAGGSSMTTRISPAVAATDGMPWATFLNRVRTAAGQL